MSSSPVGRLGDYIREQREGAAISVRRLAADAGVSNPYLSQIERGLRKPSAEVLQQIAKGLRISAEQLYVRAGLLDERESGLAVEAAIVGDAAITERQKRVLLDIYASFLTENGVATAEVTPKPARARTTTKATKTTRTSRTTRTGPTSKATKTTKARTTASRPTSRTATTKAKKG
ncbi:MAG: helix-turn-helix transcriptional regulator [Actinomycetes bacterium]